jgi:hypothetical protein
MNKGSKNKELTAHFPPKVADPRQGQLSLGISKQIEIDGVGMGVLSDGTPFLTGRGLASLCGVTHRAIQDISDEWTEDVQKPRVTAIKAILRKRGIERDTAYVAITQRGGTFFAYSDAVCLAVLEYYAFDAGSNIKQQAQSNFRELAGQALRDFIYAQVGYDPNALVPNAWKIFHDRVSLTYSATPKGHFGIFKEIADIIVALGQAGLHIDPSFVPDGSVGKHWSTHWTAIGGDGKFGSRQRYGHNFPEYFPQADSNPQDAWCYPNGALGEFRRWIEDDYIGKGKFGRYLDSKVKQRSLPPSFTQLAIAALSSSE